MVMLEQKLKPRGGSRENDMRRLDVGEQKKDLE
jgi:hypothetical protein